ncbi:hypothetical protein QUA40_24620 [Microcoleus sp. Pol11C3]|uniref:hypothetical protein n=1 Tax=Microcoleus sp. Pol11C3 TaxID=3055390 RepID=UPI002FCEAC93
MALRRGILSNFANGCLRLSLNQLAKARSHSLQSRSTSSPSCPNVKFCDNLYLVALDTELSVIVRAGQKKPAHN